MISVEDAIDYGLAVIVLIGFALHFTRPVPSAGPADVVTAEAQRHREDIERRISRGEAVFTCVDVYPGREETERYVRAGRSGRDEGLFP